MIKKIRSKLNIILCLCLLGINIQSCLNEEKPFSSLRKRMEDPPKIDIRNPSKDRKLSDYLEIVSIVPLEINDNAVLRNVDKIFIHEDTIFIIHLESMSIKAFDFQGNYLYDIGDIGKGPGEFVFLQDVNLSFDKRSIVVNDLGLKKLIYYSYDGKLSQEIKTPFHFYYFSQLDKGQWAFYMNFITNTNPNSTKPTTSNLISNLDNSANVNFTITNNSFELLHTYFPLDLENDLPAYREDGSLFSTSRGGVLVHEAHSDTIFEWVDGNYFVKYIFSFTDKRKNEKLDTRKKRSDRSSEEGSVARPIF